MAPYSGSVLQTVQTLSARHSGPGQPVDCNSLYTSWSLSWPSSPGGDYPAAVAPLLAMLLLMLSGDVETNPGPAAEELGEIRLDIKYTDGRIKCNGKFYF